MLLNFTCNKMAANGDEVAVAALEAGLSAESYNFSITAHHVQGGATIAMPPNKMALLNEQYDAFKAFLNETGSTIANLSDDCRVFYDLCRFSRAQRCFQLQIQAEREDRIARQVFYAGYLPSAVCLVTMALLLNALSILLVSRVPHKTPRHFLLINLSISDFLLSFFTVLKRSADFIPHELVQTAIIVYVNMFWQAVWLLSAFGILFVAVDCFLAIGFVYLYGDSKTAVTIRVIVAGLWLGSFTFTGLLILFQMSYSNVVQFIIVIMMFTILTAIVAQSIYVFSLAERVRRAQVQMTLHNTMSKRHARLSRLKSSLTIVIMLASSFFSWLPLVIYMMLPFLMDFNRWHDNNVYMSQVLLTVCLGCFHMNAIVNPIVYSLRFKDIRAPLRHYLSNNRFTKPLGQFLQRLDEDVQALFTTETRHRRKTVSCSTDAPTERSDGDLKSSALLLNHHHGRNNKGRSASYGFAVLSPRHRHQSCPKIVPPPSLSSIAEHTITTSQLNNDEATTSSHLIEEVIPESETPTVDNSNVFITEINDETTQQQQEQVLLTDISNVDRRMAAFKTGHDSLDYGDSVL